MEVDIIDLSAVIKNEIIDEDDPIPDSGNGPLNPGNIEEIPRIKSENEDFPESESTSSKRKHDDITQDSSSSPKKSKTCDVLDVPIKQENPDPDDDTLDACKCPECPFTCRRDLNLKKHMRHHSTKVGRKCPHCSFRAITLAAIKKHEMLHEERELALKCAKCPALLTSNADFNKHMSLHHNNLSHEGEESNDELPVLDKYTNDDRVENLPEQPVIMEENSHSKPVENKDQKGSDIPNTTSRGFKCISTGCPFKADSYVSLKRHRVYHQRKGPLKCQYCSFRCKGQDLLTSHLFQHINAENCLGSSWDSSGKKEELEDNEVSNYVLRRKKPEQFKKKNNIRKIRRILRKTSKQSLPEEPKDCNTSTTISAEHKEVDASSDDPNPSNKSHLAVVTTNQEQEPGRPTITITITTKTKNYNDDSLAFKQVLVDNILKTFGVPNIKQSTPTKSGQKSESSTAEESPRAKISDDIKSCDIHEQKEDPAMVDDRNETKDDNQIEKETGTDEQETDKSGSLESENTSEKGDTEERESENIAETPKRGDSGMDDKKEEDMCHSNTKSASLESEKEAEIPKEGDIGIDDKEEEEDICDPNAKSASLESENNVDIFEAVDTGINDRKEETPLGSENQAGNLKNGDTGVDNEQEDIESEEEARAGDTGIDDKEEEEDICDLNAKSASLESENNVDIFQVVDTGINDRKEETPLGSENNENQAGTLKNGDTGVDNEQEYIESEEEARAGDTGIENRIEDTWGFYEKSTFLDGENEAETLGNGTIETDNRQEEGTYENSVALEDENNFIIPENYPENLFTEIVIIQKAPVVEDPDINLETLEANDTLNEDYVRNFPQILSSETSPKQGTVRTYSVSKKKPDKQSPEQIPRKAKTPTSSKVIIHSVIDIDVIKSEEHQIVDDSHSQQQQHVLYGDDSFYDMDNNVDFESNGDRGMENNEKHCSNDEMTRTLVVGSIFKLFEDPEDSFMYFGEDGIVKNLDESVEVPAFEKNVDDEDHNTSVLGMDKVIYEVPVPSNFVEINNVPNSNDQSSLDQQPREADTNQNDDQSSLDQQPREADTNQNEARSFTPIQNEPTIITRPETPKEPEDNVTYPTRCPHCPTSCPNRNFFKMHLKAHSFVEGGIKCPVCTYRGYKDCILNHLRCHVRQCNGVFGCPLCKEVKKTNEFIVDHIKVTHSDSIFKEHVARCTKYLKSRCPGNCLKLK